MSIDQSACRGVLTALVTPFLESPAGSPAIDYDAWESLIEWQLASKVDGLVIFGTTGESATLEVDEKLELARRTLAIVKGRVPVIAGSGSNNTRKSIELTRELKDIGVDAALAVAPYYNKPTQEGLYQHFRTLAQEGGLPIVLYNVPSRTSVSISVETFARLAKLPEVIAVKQASDSAGELTELAAALNGNAALLAGDDPIVYVVMALGGTGVISASASVIPERMKAITDNVFNGNWEQALVKQQEALPYIHALFRETNPAPAKAALKILGRLPHETLRLPLVPVTETTRAELSELFGNSK